jgi:hypothetical protein
MSQKLEVNFVESSPFALQKFHALSLFLLCLGLAISAFTAYRYQSFSQANEEAYAALNQIKPEKKVLVVQHETKQVPLAELKQIQETTSLLSTPWNALFSAIEQVDMKDIALLSIDPSIKKQHVTFVGEAKNVQAALNFIEALEALPMLSQVYLQKHHIDQQDPYKPVGFTILAQWS